MSLQRLKPAQRGSAPASGADPRSRRNHAVLGGIVATVLLAVRLGLPGPVEPAEVPFPTLEAALLEAQLAERQRLRTGARAHRLPLSVRAVGELVRRAGRAEAARDADGLSALKLRLRRQVSAVRTESQVERLLELRELQTELFESAVSQWDGSEEVPSELLELGGGFAQHMQAFIAAERVSLVPMEIAAAFRLRWTELTGLSRDSAFAATANEQRLNARLRLRIAALTPEPSQGPALLRTIETLSQLDATYPASFARGVVYYQSRSFKEAFDAFKAHLDEHPDGPWTLRAQNHALASAQALLGAR